MRIPLRWLIFGLTLQFLMISTPAYAEIEITWESNWGEMVFWESENSGASNWLIGQAITPPSGADVTQKPDLGDKTDDFYWSTVNQTLYAIRPGSSVIYWSDGAGGTIPELGNQTWPEGPLLQLHVSGTPEVDLITGGGSLGYVEMLFTNSSDASVSPTHEFTSTALGYSVLLYAATDPAVDQPVFEVIRTIDWNSTGLLESNWDIAKYITDGGHDNSCGQGYVYHAVSSHVINTNAEAPFNGYDRTQLSGPIVAVNTDKTPADESDDLVVVWYNKGSESGVCWPSKRVRYQPEWPTNADKIIIASQTGTGVLNPTTYLNPEVYAQPDNAISGYNPNEEHALLFPATGGGGNALFALRDDLNASATSEAYSILRYQKPTDNNNWYFLSYQVVAEEDPHFFQYTGTAGTLIQPPYPLSDFPTCEGSNGVSGPYWKDYKNYLWAKAAGLDGNATNIVTQFHENWEGTCTAWLDYGTGTPQNITYTVDWPEAPSLYVAETLITPKNNLPDITNQCAVEIIFDQHKDLTHSANASVQLINPVTEQTVELSVLPPEIATRNVAGKLIFLDLPFHLQTRLSYDPLNFMLGLKGIVDESGVGEPLVLLNILSARERDQLLLLSNNVAYQIAVEALYQESRLQLDGQTKLKSGSKALTAGSATGTGYVTLAMQNDQGACDPLPVSLEIIKVVPQLYKGEIKVIEPDDAFDERVTLRHNGDFGGVADPRTFEWRTLPDTNGTPPAYDPAGDNLAWTAYSTSPSTGLGSLDITIEGPGLNTLKDKWFITRYKGYDVVGNETWSDWTAPQLYQGWIKRVTQGLNPFEQRAKDFHTADVNTFASMIIQAGERFEGNVALNGDPNNVNSFGLIELYETVLNRGKSLSVNGTPPVDDPGANQALLLAAGRVSDLYMLLGNEAFADSMDPTIGFGTEHGQYGAASSSLFSFMNQVPSLLDEELALLRGRDDTGGTATNVKPLYNRLPWNFTSGIDGGEVAYSLNYNLEDQDDNGSIDEYDAKLMFPQGHGDAWGHYLSAVKSYYDLLRNPNYTWQPRSESVSVAGLPVQVDYLDERKFAQAAAAKARTGADVMNLTYRQSYLEDPNLQWQGYKDSVAERAWGVDGWASRAGEGALFDWVAANAMLPPEDSTNTGIAKVDRTTVVEIREIASQFNAIQAIVDKGNIGLNPVGLVSNAVPFDLDPQEVADDKTHFEQVSERAVQALKNAVTLFDHANQNDQRLRGQEDALEKFQDNVTEREADFKNRMIEIFGYPYPDDIGPSGTYPDGYDGPDLYHHMYVDPSELMGINPPATETFEVDFKEYDPTDLSSTTKSVTFHSAGNGYGLIKPSSWNQRRRAPGKLQMARADLLQAKGRFLQGIVNYNNLVNEITDAGNLIDARNQLTLNEVKVFEERNNNLDVEELLSNTSTGATVMKNRMKGLHSKIFEAQQFSQKLQTEAETFTRKAQALIEGYPKVIGAGTSVISDPSAALRAVVAMEGLQDWSSSIEEQGSQELDKLIQQQNLTLEEQSYQLDQEKRRLEHETARTVNQNLDQISLLTHQNDFAVQQDLAALTQLVREEKSLRLELLTLQENLKQLSGRYSATLAEGERLLDAQLRFRKQTAGDVQDYRYQDMAFRIFRNDALQKFNAQFEMATLYTYLAAKAYDYETNLLGTDGQAGQQFLTDIIKERSIGSVVDGQPAAGSGLSDILYRLNQNFSGLKTSLGLNNPQTETNRFSLRKELFRIKEDAGSNENWKRKLQSFVVPDLWDVKEFRRYAIFAGSKEVDQPGLVIPMSTTITPGLNFFGWPLGGGDSYYSATNFSTKIGSVGVWFSDFNALGNVNTPRVYLIPVGMDVLRTPKDYTFETREWQVVDQHLPIPSLIDPASAQFNDPSWLPSDSLSDELYQMRRHSDFRAYHDAGTFDASEMNFDSRLIGRSVWNTQWLLIIPGLNLNNDPEEGLDTLINGSKIIGTENRTGQGISDIKIFFQTYSYSGN